jgi:hypothetical protein
LAGEKLEKNLKGGSKGKIFPNIKVFPLIYKNDAPVL